MSQTLLVCLTLLLACASATGKTFSADTKDIGMVAFTISKDYKTFFFNQTFDHFNYKQESQATFRQKYVINSKYWGGANANAPIFAYLGKQGPIDDDVAAVGFLPENAEHFGALLIYMEHRYYGESIPYGLNQEKIVQMDAYRGYFNSAQALADYATILIHIKNERHAQDSPIIVIGGSYGGMLASWFRLKYPHIAIGALASSAPILYFYDIIPQDGYYGVITNDFKAASEDCYDTIRESWLEIDKRAATPQGLSQLSRIFKTCEPLTDSSVLKNYLTLTYASASQYNAPPSYPVMMICNAINSRSVSLLEKIFDGMVVAKGNQSCYVNQPDAPTQTESGWVSQWQSCTEIVIRKGVTRSDSMFQLLPFNFNDYKEKCMTQYGVTPQLDWITTYYGGHDIGRVLKSFGSNIIFSNGLNDPYSSGGILDSISDSIIAVTTLYGSHILDILRSKPSDPAWLVEQRETELQIIEDWIENYHVDLHS